MRSKLSSQPAAEMSASHVALSRHVFLCQKPRRMPRSQGSRPRAQSGQQRQIVYRGWTAHGELRQASFKGLREVQ